MTARGPKMADRVWEGVYPKIFGCSHQLWVNKIFYPRTPSMRKVDDRGNQKIGMKIMLFIVDTYIVTRRLPEHQPTGTPTTLAKNLTGTYRTNIMSFL